VDSPLLQKNLDRVNETNPQRRKVSNVKGEIIKEQYNEMKKDLEK
jgi:hypothetical protein